MKKMTILSIVAATLLFTGCGDDATDKASDATAKAVESTKEAASSIADAAKEAADKAMDAAKDAGDSVSKAASEAAETTKNAADKAIDSAKESAVEVAASATAAVDSIKNVAGAEAYVKCSACHGADGKTKALGKSPEIAGLAKDDLVKMLKEYKAGTRNVSGMGTLMKGQVATMSDEDIEAVSAHISAL